MDTLFSKAAMDANSERRFALSGTPMGGKIENLFPILKWLEPKVYSSKWDWANQWLVVTRQQVVTRGGKMRTFMDVGGIKPGLEEKFYESLAPHFVRRLRSEVLPQLPPKQYIDVPCVMTPKQRKQYKQFATDAEVRIEERRLTATGILAEYQRLKQFADAYCDRIDSTDIECHKCKGTGYFEGASCFRCQGTGVWTVLHPIPSPDSGKLEPLLERLAESGIDPKEPTGDTQVVIASQFKEMIDMVHRHLNEIGIPAEKMTGDTRSNERDRIRKVFQAGEGPRVLCMTTGTGGVAIELNRASEIHILDETWDPDDQEQLEDRLIDTNKEHQVTCLYYRMQDSIDEYIQRVTEGKAVTNKVILDLRRQGFRATALKRAA
jgi:SNF2 family DNA or RNA helicase